MRNLTSAQRAYLRQVTAQRARLDKALAKAEVLREELEAMLAVGREQGISTYRLAEAAAMSQPNVTRLTS